MTKKFKSYKEYLEQDKLNKTSPEKLAPPGALPKLTKGDSHAYRRKQASQKKRNVIEIKGVKITKAARKRLEA